MSIIDQVARAGLHVVSGRLRLQEALTAGLAIQAMDLQGNRLRISPGSNGVKIEPEAPFAPVVNTKANPGGILIIVQTECPQ